MLRWMLIIRGVIMGCKTLDVALASSGNDKFFRRGHKLIQW